MKQNEWIRKNISLFYGVDPETVDGLLRAEGCRMLRLEKGAALCRAKEPNDGLILILRGKAEVLKGSMRLRTLLAGDVTGVSTLFGETRLMESDILAESRLEALYFPRKAVRDALREDPVFSENYIAFLSSRIGFLNGVISLCSGADSTERAARFLYEESCTKGEVFALNVSRAAAGLNMSRASFYRALALLQEAGFIRRENGKICIRDKEQLRTIH